MREHVLHRLLMDVTVIPLDERLLALEPREDDSLAARGLRGLDAETSRRRGEGADHVGEAGGARLGEGRARPCADEPEGGGRDDLHRATSLSAGLPRGFWPSAGLSGR